MALRQFGFETKEERDGLNRSAKAQGYETMAKFGGGMNL